MTLWPAARHAPGPGDACFSEAHWPVTTAELVEVALARGDTVILHCHWLSLTVIP
jgi:hypothetical protein